MGDFFGELYLRTTRPFLSDALTRAEAEFIGLALQLMPGERVLDICCGHGRHAERLIATGHPQVFGLDLDALSLRSAPEVLKGRAVRADMHHQPFRACFDAAYAWYASLFRTDDGELNQQVLREAGSVLRTRGRLLVHTHNALRLKTEPQLDAAITLSDGSRVEETTSFDAARGILRGHRVLMGGATGEGSPERRRLEGTFEVWCPLPEEIRTLAAACGFQLTSVWGDLDGSAHTATSPEAIYLLVRQG